MKTRKELLNKIKESIAQISEEKYNHIREYRYIWFAKNGEYGGCGHYKLNLEGTPLEKAEPLTYLAPMASKKVMIAAIQEMIDRLGETSHLTDQKKIISLEKIEEHLFGAHADRYNRLSKFFEIEERIHPEFYGQTLKKVYHDSIKKYRYRDELRKAFQKAPRQGLMTKDEEEVLNNLDDQVTIYRALSTKENELKDYGVSWTLYEDIATQIGHHCFGNIWEQARFFTKKIEVAKGDLHAFFNQRNMWEVIYVQQDTPPQEFEITLLQKP